MGALPKTRKRESCNFRKLGSARIVGSRVQRGVLSRCTDNSPDPGAILFVCYKLVVAREKRFLSYAPFVGSVFRHRYRERPYLIRQKHLRVERPAAMSGFAWRKLTVRRTPAAIA